MATSQPTAISICTILSSIPAFMPNPPCETKVVTALPAAAEVSTEIWDMLASERRRVKNELIAAGQLSISQQLNSKSIPLMLIPRASCGNCHSIDRVLLRCARCKVARYCNTECQTAHWKLHRSFCFSTLTVPSCHLATMLTIVVCDDQMTARGPRRCQSRSMN
jgi:hypothetical protein